jgi:hypothetical protein
MYISKGKALLLFLFSVLASGCSSRFQQDVPGDGAGKLADRTGIITGTVTAPMIDQHNGIGRQELVVFAFRSLEGGYGSDGIVTSAGYGAAGSLWESMTSMPNVESACERYGMGAQCGRPFALALPSGQYEIYEVRVGGDPYALSPAVFTVVDAKVTYLGDLHAGFCSGMAHSMRGAILGGIFPSRITWSETSNY